MVKIQRIHTIYTVQLMSQKGGAVAPDERDLAVLTEL